MLTAALGERGHPEEIVDQHQETLAGIARVAQIAVLAVGERARQLVLEQGESIGP